MIGFEQRELFALIADDHMFSYLGADNCLPLFAFSKRWGSQHLLVAAVRNHVKSIFRTKVKNTIENESEDELAEDINTSVSANEGDNIETLDCDESDESDQGEDEEDREFALEQTKLHRSVTSSNNNMSPIATKPHDNVHQSRCINPACGEGRYKHQNEAEESTRAGDISPPKRLSNHGYVFGRGFTCGTTGRRRNPLMPQSKQVDDDSTGYYTWPKNTQLLDELIEANHRGNQFVVCKRIPRGKNNEIVHESKVFLVGMTCYILGMADLMNRRGHTSKYCYRICKVVGRRPKDYPYGIHFLDAGDMRTKARIRQRRSGLGTLVYNLFDPKKIKRYRESITTEAHLWFERA
ncbi:uncharacterized protein EV154DRAFT_568580 [Mucor mucedo]|uniref:uncharacterized protein n=1 Tax=Mucor mucedo TaxID=29922 RepID=UPI0022206993|nr:uncharacterized protein EV154DRAFT_568580 [Mucor mucedo]KAI7880030.1 hypothetical protein EV154DRAFT_568580 [Mucor mucedo]